MKNIYGKGSDIMLRIQELVETLGKEYEPMIAQIKIAEFTKTIAQFSGQRIENVPDEVIKDYLVLWAMNKFRFFKMLGNRTKVDIPFSYIDETRDTYSEMKSLIKDYPAYAPWLHEMASFKSNKIEVNKWDWRDKILDYLSDVIDTPVKRTLSDMAITTFFKRTLNAPDELVTKIGRVYENDAIDATFTISIDPVDMMMASENPYNWTSCYRLELMSDSHADGCLAAVLDDTSLITYVWNNKGKYHLYNTYEMKEIRYYRMREWINISENFATIHFNAIYPGKSCLSDGFNKKYRDMVETFVTKAMFPDKENIWAKTTDAYAERDYYYGYGEFSECYMWTLKGEKSQHIHAYNQGIPCPCGCGGTLPCTDDGNDDESYNGEGLICENFYERHWCDAADDYCDYEDCEHCSIWNRDNAVCELDTTHYCDEACEAESDGCFDPEDDNIVNCGAHCDGCPFYALHHPEEEEEEDSDTEIKSVSSDNVIQPTFEIPQTTINNNINLGTWWLGSPSNSSLNWGYSTGENYGTPIHINNYNYAVTDDDLLNSNLDNSLNQIMAEAYDTARHVIGDDLQRGVVWDNYTITTPNIPNGITFRRVTEDNNEQ